MFKDNKKHTRTMPLAWCFYYYLWTYFTPCFIGFFVNFEQVNAGWVNSLNRTGQRQKSNRVSKCHISACFLNMPSNCQTECLLPGSYIGIRWSFCLDYIASLVQQRGLIYKQLIAGTLFFQVKQKFCHWTLDPLLLSAFIINCIPNVQDQELTWPLGEII